MKTLVNWQTGLAGVLSLILLGLTQTPGISPALAHIFTVVAGALPAIGLLFARDGNKTSEQCGMTPTPVATPAQPFPKVP